MNIPVPSNKDIEQILNHLGYTDLAVVSNGWSNNCLSYDGYLDTYYRIRIEMKSVNKMEIWDCIYDEENFVRAGVAHLRNGSWAVVEG